MSISGSASARRSPFHTAAPADKVQARASLLAARRARSNAARAEGGIRTGDPTPDLTRALTDAVIGLPEVAAAGTVAAYVAMAGEPPTAPLLEALRARGKRVILPILLPGGDLDWARYDGAGSLEAPPGRRVPGLLQPTGRHLGPAAVADADVVVAPGLAVGADGIRLGRGGGSYDRALARISPRTPVVVLLWDGELLDAVPREPHDRPVDIAVTPTVLWRFPPRSPA